MNARLFGQSILGLIKNRQAIFQCSCTTLCSDNQRVRIPVAQNLAGIGVVSILDLAILIGGYLIIVSNCDSIWSYFVEYLASMFMKNIGL